MITSKGWDTQYYLRYKLSQVNAVPGDKVILRNETVVTLVGGSAPHSEASTGRVEVQYADGTKREFYPAVADMEWARYGMSL